MRSEEVQGQKIKDRLGSESNKYLIAVIFVPFPLQKGELRVKFELGDEKRYMTIYGWYTTLDYKCLFVL